MARAINKLAATALKAPKPGKHCDGGGLWLIVGKDGAARWTFRYMMDKRAREMGLGAYPTVTLAAARSKATAAREMVAAGLDPIEESRKAQEKPTFGDFAIELVDKIEGQWRNTKHRQQWRNTLATYCGPVWSVKVDKITVDDVLKCLSPIWADKRETASRLRGRIEFVLDAAKAKGLRSGENPATWRGNLKHLLQDQGKRTHEHHAALRYAEVPAFYSALGEREALAADALRLLILTATRTSEVLNASWPEIDLEANVWTIPPNRMKAGKEHRIPLTPAALAILEKLKPLAKTGQDGNLAGWIFPGQRRDCPLSNMSLLMLLRRTDRGDITAHGFRSSFRDWCSEASNFPSELAEQALAHTVGSAVERAYRRGDALERRRNLMEAWSGFVTRPAGGSVVPMRGMQ